MKRIIIGVCSIVAFLSTMVSCSEERITYTDNNYVMFSDTLKYLPVQNSTEYFDINIAATKSCGYDRNFGVEIIDKRSNAIEGVHYTVESNTVTIKAGETKASFRLRGLHNNINVQDSLGITVKLIVPEDAKWDIYANGMLESKIIFSKACPFELNTFSGYLTLQSTFFDSYMKDTKMRLLKSEVNEQNNTITIKDMFYKGFNVTVRPDTTNIQRPDLYMDDDQMIGTTDESFGTIYGNGKLMSYLPGAYTSYYSNCEGFMVQYMTMYVDGVGTVGTFVNVLKWITDEEAEVLKRQGY